MLKFELGFIKISWHFIALTKRIRGPHFHFALEKLTLLNAIVKFKIVPSTGEMCFTLQCLSAGFSKRLESSREPEIRQKKNVEKTYNH